LNCYAQEFIHPKKYLNMSGESVIKSLLNRVQEAYKNMIVEESKSITEGNQFNVFNVIGLWSEEVRLHSAIIKELLDPSGSHGCSDHFLRLFFEKVYNLTIPEGMYLAKTIVEAEYYIGPISDDNKEGGRIDIFVEVPKELNLPSLIIENKIYALDQENQLLRYYNFGNKEYSNQFILTYLTLDGKQPSAFSLGDCNSIKPYCISYRNHIMTWLLCCAQVAFNKPKVRETIIQYIDLLKQITEYTMQEMDNIVKAVASSDEDLISGLLICSRRNGIIQSAIMGPITKVLNEVAQKAESNLNHLRVKYIPYNKLDTRGGKIDWNFKFLISTYDGKQQVCLKYIFNNWDLADLYYGIDKEETAGVPVTPIFPDTTDYWRYGWAWVPDEYRSWDCVSICKILEQIKVNGSNSNFAKSILETINQASTLLKDANTK